MAEREIDRIVVNSRTVVVGDEALAISEIARLRIVSYRDRRGYSAGDKLLQNLSIAALFFGLFTLSLNNTSDLGNLCAFGGAAIAILITIYANTGPLLRLLLIEVSSGGVSIFRAKHFDPLRDLKTEILRFIQDPPRDEKTITIPTVYSIDLRNSSGVQIGNGNTQVDS